MMGFGLRGARRTISAAAALASPALLIACGDNYCTLMGSYTGIRVAVAPKLARTVADATILICWDDTCRMDVLRLPETLYETRAPGSPVLTTETPTETPTAPDASATNIQNPRVPAFAGPPGYAVVPDLPEEPADVTLTFKNKRGKTVLNQSITVTPESVYPNGRECSPDGPWAGITVSEDGVLTER